MSESKPEGPEVPPPPPRQPDPNLKGYIERKNHRRESDPGVEEEPSKL